jgi:predicted ribosome quality control (RQC) complex YloA/Tae2 family protein
MTSALLLAATVRHLNSLKPRFLKKFRESTFGSHIIVLNTDVGEAWIVLDTVLGVFLPIEETPIIKPSRGFTLNIKRMIEGAKVSDIAQPDLERIVHIQLQTRRRDLHLYLELFGGGNIVLTNSDGKIIACRRA